MVAAPSADATNSDERTSPPRLPFGKAGALEGRALAAYYDHLHASDFRTFRDERSGLWPVWGYANVERIIKGVDPAASNKNTLDPLTPLWKFALNPATWPSLAHLVTVPPATANSNGVRHDEVRRAVFGRPGGLSLGMETTQAQFGALIRSRVTMAVDRLERSGSDGPVDFAAVFARPLSAGIISEIVGFSDEDEKQVQSWSEAQTSLLGRALDRRGQVAGVRGLSRLSRACGKLVTKRSVTPADDLASHLLEYGLSAKRAAATLMNILAAGYSTTYGTLLNAMRHLLSDEGRGHWELVRDETVVLRLTDELLRLETGLTGWKRLAREEVRLDDDAVIPAGGQILLMIGAANRDPACFRDPHQVRFDRQDRKEPRGVTFGSGPHLCMGREVSRLEICYSLSTLRERFPNLRLALPEGEVRYDHDDYLLRTPQALPVRL